MTRRSTDAEAWGQGLGFWFRLWQVQVEQSLKFWAIWAQAVPRPSAAELSAQAEALGASAPAEPPSRGPRKAATR